MIYYENKSLYRFWILILADTAHVRQTKASAMYFTDDQTRRLNDLTRQFEDDTGAEIVVTVVDK